MYSKSAINTGSGNAFYDWIVAFNSAYLKSKVQPVGSITRQVPLVYQINEEYDAGEKNNKRKRGDKNGIKTQYCILLHNVCEVDLTFDGIGVTQGHVYESDLVAVVDCILTNFQTIQVYERAVIKGVKFRCRGFEFADRKADVEEVNNNLVENWSNRKHYSSWCRVKNYQADDDMSISAEILFGQLNYCFRLNFPVDKYIHGLAMGHCSIRNNCIYSEQRWNYYVKADVGVGGLKANRFVCLNYVDSSAIAVSALNSDDEPILSGEISTSFTSPCSIQTLNKIVDKIFLIPIHPERLNFEYRSIFPDIDNTRLVEPDCIFRHQ